MKTQTTQINWIIPVFLFSINLIFVECKPENKNSPIAEISKEIKTVTSQPVKPKNNTFFQHNIWWAFVNKVFSSDLTVAELKEKGDVGLGSFNFLDGEMIMIDGVAYRIREDGKVTTGENSDIVVYANAAFFEEEGAFKIPADGLNFKTLQSAISDKLSSSNYFYIFKIKGQFDYVKCGGLKKQTPPFDEGLDILIPNRPIFEAEKVSGTIIGFYCPDFIGDINVKGYHFHFITDNKSMGGHLMEFKADGPLEVRWDQKEEYHFDLPGSKELEKGGFEKRFQYKEAKEE